MALLTVLPGGEEYQLSPVVSILNTLLRNGHQIMHKCGGKAQCGTCRVEIVAGAERLSPVRPPERERLGEEWLQAGRRLACQTFAFGDVTIRIPPADS